MKKVKIPNYTLGEELINSISHGIGALLSVAGLIIMIVKSLKDDNLSFVACLIYGISLILLYLISCLYHALSPKLEAKKILRVIDHCNVFLLEAGTFTPICLLLIRGKLGFIYCFIIWILTIVGIIINYINVDKYQKISLILHLLIGWSIILLLSELILSLNATGLVLLFGGGILYSIGAILYKIGATKRYMHSIFHFFCLAGSVFHFLLIFLFAI